MKVLTAAEMKEIDRKTIEEIGIPGPVLMENAGLQVVRALKEKFPEPQKERIVIVAGKGNNGGDGLVVARHLFNQGCNPLVFLLASKAEIKGDAAINLKITASTGVPIVEVNSIQEWKKQRLYLFQSTIIIDAIFGTGLMKPAENLYAVAIEDINRARGFKISIDIPSGLSSDSYQLIGPCVKANLTVTLGVPKIAHIFPPAEEYVGELIVADISIPRFLFDDKKLNLELVEKNTLYPYFRKRKKDTHKGTYGHLFILSGSMGKTGAAAMAGKAALKMGAGLVTVGTPASCLPIVARSMMELMTESLAETEEKTISSQALPKVFELLEGKDAILLGPGISTHPSTSELVLSLIPKIKIPAVIDADGLNIISHRPDILRSIQAKTVLTPHPGEFARLLGCSTKEVVERKLDLVPSFAEKYGVYLVLKGYRTLVAAPDGRVFINSTGNPGMATAGSGDVLSGMIGSLIMQEKDFLGAILAAVYVHGLSSDLAVARLGERFLTAGDIIRYFPQAMKAMEGQ